MNRRTLIQRAISALTGLWATNRASAAELDLSDAPTAHSVPPAVPLPAFTNDYHFDNAVPGHFAFYRFERIVAMAAHKPEPPSPLFWPADIAANKTTNGMPTEDEPSSLFWLYLEARV